jgi:DtxR family transcriptional regulator, Mn-dependent transcriptional regulator
MLRYLAAQGIRPGVALTLTEQLPFKGSYQVRVGRPPKLTQLSESLADAISVQPSQSK